VGSPSRVRTPSEKLPRRRLRPQPELPPRAPEQCDGAGPFSGRRRRRRRRRSTGRPATRPATAAPASFRGARTRRAGAARARSIAARVRAATARRRRAERPPSTRLDASTLRRTRRRRGCRIDAATPSRRPSVPDGASERAALFREEGGVAGAPRPRRNGPGRQPTSDFSRDDFRRGLGDFSETRRPRPAATPRIVRGATRHVDAESAGRVESREAEPRKNAAPRRRRVLLHGVRRTDVQRRRARRGVAERAADPDARVVRTRGDSSPRNV